LPVFTSKIYLFGPERVQTVKIGLNPLKSRDATRSYKPPAQAGG
jgi:hypothetical protein